MKKSQDIAMGEKKTEDVRSLQIALGAYVLVLTLKLAAYFMSICLPRVGGDAATT